MGYKSQGKMERISNILSRSKAVANNDDEVWGIETAYVFKLYHSKATAHCLRYIFSGGREMLISYVSTIGKPVLRYDL